MKKRLTYLFALMVAGALTVPFAVSCEEEEQAPEGPTKLWVQLSKTKLAATETSVEGTVDCDADWEVKLDKTTWAIVEKSAKESNKFTVSFDPNTLSTERSGTVVVTSGKLSKSVSFTQAAKDADEPGPTPPDPPQPEGPAPGLYGVDGVDFVLGEDGWNQSSRVVCNDGSLQYLLMNRAKADCVGILEYDPTAAVGDIQTVVLFRMDKTGVTMYQPIQVMLTESAGTYIELANSKTLYFRIQK
ncbi:MAG: BACON domain-containing protein [Bacteroidales bacterium]|nr:BACON domain-containing protein [Bacteroidales bacterium]